MKYFLELKKPNKKLLKSKFFLSNYNNYRYQFPCIFQLFLNSIFTSWLGIRIQEEQECGTGSTALAIFLKYKSPPPHIVRKG